MQNEELIFKYAPWSISKTQTGIACPKQFEFKFVNKVKEAVPRSENKVGVASHALLEQRLLGKDFKEAKKLALEKTPLTSNEEDNLSVLVVAIEAFLTRFDAFCKTQGVEQLLIERKWGLNKTFKACAFNSKETLFRGVVDLACITKNKDLIVIDHKSGSIQGLSKYKDQLNSYAILGLVNNSDISGMQGAVHFMQADSADKAIQWAEYQNAKSIKDNLFPWLVIYLEKAAEAVNDLSIAKPRKPWPCEWCPYRTICDAYANKFSSE